MARLVTQSYSVRNACNPRALPCYGDQLSKDAVGALVFVGQNQSAEARLAVGMARAPSPTMVKGAQK